VQLICCARPARAASYEFKPISVVCVRDLCRYFRVRKTMAFYLADVIGHGALGFATAMLKFHDPRLLYERAKRMGQPCVSSRCVLAISPSAWIVAKLAARDHCSAATMAWNPDIQYLVVLPLRLYCEGRRATGGQGSGRSGG